LGMPDHLDRLMAEEPAPSDHDEQGTESE